MHQRAEVLPKSKGTFKCNSFHMPFHMAVCKTDSDKTSFICKAKRAAALQMQRHPLCTWLTKTHRVALQTFLTCFWTCGNCFWNLHRQISQSSLGISPLRPNGQCRRDFRTAEQRRFFQDTGKAVFKEQHNLLAELR